MVGAVIVGTVEADSIDGLAATGFGIELAEVASSNPHVTFCIAVAVTVDDCLRIGTTVSVGPGTVVTSDVPRMAGYVDVPVAVAVAVAFETEIGSSNPAFFAHVSRSSPSRQQKPATGAQYLPASQNPLSVAQHVCSEVSISSVLSRCMLHIPGLD